MEHDEKIHREFYRNNPMDPIDEVVKVLESAKGDEIGADDSKSDRNRKSGKVGAI